MANRKLPDQRVLVSLLDYDPSSGSLAWKERPLDLFPDARSGKIWNSRYADKEAFSTSDANGYRRGAIFNVAFLAHRVIWKIMTGDEPDVIDHIDGNPANNAWSNLRSVDPIANAKNQKMHARNKTGVVGVWRAPPSRRGQKIWEARIGRSLIGYFDSFDDAVIARKEAEVKHGFHENHGRTA